MDSPWRRTLASVFLLLSPHNVRVLCQNVIPNGQLPLLRESTLDGIVPGIVPQWNLLPGPPNVFPGEYMPPEFRYIPEFAGPTLPQAAPFGPGLPANTLSTQGPAFNLPQLNYVSAPQGSMFNFPPNYVPPPQGLPLNIPQTPLVPIPFGDLPYNGLPVINTPLIPQASIAPIPLVPIPTGPVCDIPLTNPFPGLQPPYIPLVPQEQMLPSLQVPLSPIPANVQGFPLASSLPPPYLPLLNNGLGMLSTDLSSVPFLPSPNPLNLLNHQIAALPAHPENPLLYADSCVDLPEEEYTPVPINLQINVPSPTIPESKIIVITAYPPAPAPPPIVTSDTSDVINSFYPPFPLPPIIIEGRRSRSRSWLPLFLIALLAGDDYNGGFGGGSGGCCCSCNSGSSVPVPYPIPIPTNNPIITGSRSSSRDTGNKTTTKS